MSTTRINRYSLPTSVQWQFSSIDSFPAFQLSLVCQKMSDLESFPSDNEPDTPSQATRSKARLGQASGSKAPPPAGSKALPPRPGSTAEPQASVRGRRPTRPATPSPKPRSLRPPPPSRQPLQSPSSSYASASPSIPPIGKWTVAGLRQALLNSDVKFSRKMSKAQLFDLFVSLGKTNSSTSKKVSKARKPINYHVSPTSSSRSSSSSPRAPRRSRPSASLGRAPDSAVPRTAPPPSPSQPSTAAPPATASRAAPHTGTTFQSPILPTPFLLPSAADASVRLPPLAAQAQPPYYHPPASPFSHQWPAAPAADVHAGNHQPATQSHWLPPSFLPTSLYGLPETSGADPCVRLPPQTVTAPLYLPSNPSIPSKPQFTLFTAVPLPTPSNAAALEPPPVPNTIKTQILAGMDIDLSSLLSLLPPAETHRQIDCGDFSVTLKNPTPNSSRPLTFSEFTIAFGRYTETVCSVFPHRRRELNDYLAIVAELALSYGGAHFYTYHKLFSAKCAVRVSQWNQCPYWGALDSDLHNRVFFSCPNISCAVCRSVAHSTISCPQVNPAIIPCPEPTQAKSTSYVPRSTTTNPPLDPKRESIPFSGNQQVCGNFNRGRCTRQLCKYLHVCSYCGGAHARIVCPVSKATNKKSRNYLSTPVNISRLSSELSHHPDTNFTSYLLSGLKQGFNPGTTCPLSHNIISNNLQSALAEPDTVDNLIKKEVESGFMIGPFNTPPFETFRISPIGVATRKFSGKKRLIIDLSAPHNSPFSSINSLIPLEEYSLHYHDIDQAITMIKNVGRGAWLAKVDITSAFKVMPIHPDFWHLFGIRWRERFYFSVRLTFGCRSSPKIFDMLSEAICWILINNYSVPHLIHLLDDFLIVSPPDAIPAENITTVQRIFAELGIPIAQEKSLGPTQLIEFLGINLDSVKFQASLPKEKIDRIILVASSFTEGLNCSKRDLLSLLGHFNFAMRIIPQGRPFISHMLALASSAHALDDQIIINQASHNEISLWITFLKQWNGLTFFYSDLVLLPDDIQLFTDAAPSVGFGGYYQGRWFASSWPPQMRDSPQSSALFELYPLVIAASLWGKKLDITQHPGALRQRSDCPLH